MTVLGRYIKNEQSASILPESRLCNLELAAQSRGSLGNFVIEN